LSDTGAISGLTDISASGSVTLSGGTANGVTYLNGSKVLTSGSAFQFNGTNELVLNNSGGDANMYFGGSSGTNRMYLARSGVNSLLVNVETSGALIFGTNGAERARITSGGVMMLGTTSGTERLTLASGAGVGTAMAFWGNGVGAAGELYVGQGGSNEAYFFNRANAFTVFGTNNTERARITSDGSLGLGVTPQTWSSTFKPAFQFGTTGSLLNGSGYTFLSTNYYQDATGTDKYITTNFATNYYQYNGIHVWRTAASGTAGSNLSFSESMRIDTSGNLLVGQTAKSQSTVGFYASKNGEVSGCLAGTTSSETQWNTYSTGAGAYRFYVGMQGTVYATNTTITAISDQRLKENIVDLDVGLDAIMALKPRKFDWKTGKGKDIKGDRGWIAQEFEAVFPDLIDTWKDPAPKGEEPYKSVRADLIPVLVKAIQEQQALITQLQADVATLKGN